MITSVPNSKRSSWALRISWGRSGVRQLGRPGGQATDGDERSRFDDPVTPNTGTGPRAFGKEAPMGSGPAGGLS